MRFPSPAAGITANFGGIQDCQRVVGLKGLPAKKNN
jgi:hypothetical protein